MSPYNDTWKVHRKNITKVASTNVSVKVFDRVQEAESAHFLLNMLATPNDLFDHIRKEASSVILKITYGYTAEAHGRDPLVDLAGRTMGTFAEATVPSRWIVDILPFLRYVPDVLPGMGWKTTGKKMKDTLNQCVSQPYEFVKQQMREKRHTTSFLSQAIENIGSDAEMEEIHKWTALSLFTGGADTVSFLSQSCSSTTNHPTDCFIFDDLLPSDDRVSRSAKESSRRTRPHNRSQSSSRLL
jgi:hypothetical protein